MGNFSTYFRTVLCACLILSGVQLIGQNNNESLNYCKNITTNGYTTGIGFSAVSFAGTAYSVFTNTGNQVYYENMNQVISAGVNAGSTTMPFSYTNTVASQRVKIWVDWNKNGVFNDVAFAGPNNGGEMMHNSGVIVSAGTITSGTINVPFGVPAGVYRLRIAGDVGGISTPCALTTSGVVVDYQIIIKNASTTDAAITRTNLPVNFATLTTMPAISLWARNIGNAAVPSGANVVIGYRVNGGTATTATITLAASWPVGNELALNSPTLMTGLVSGEVNTVQSWIETVNGVAPPTTGNDSLVWYTFHASAINNMSGSYTVDRTTTGTRNFPTIQHALNALRTCGVAGPTTINVAANTYWENPNITTAISGTSAVNTVTIQGADSSNTIIRPAVTNAANYYGVLLASCSFVTFRNFQIRREDATNVLTGNILLHMRATTSCNIRRNAIYYRGAAFLAGGGAATQTGYAGICISNTASGSTAITSGGSTAYTLCNIDSNTIDHGNYGIFTVNSTTSNVNTFSRNTFTNQYQYPVYISGGHAIKVLYCNIRPRTTTTTTYGIYCSGGSPVGNTYDFIGNNIQDAGYMGIYVLSGTNPSTAKGNIQNNMISGFRTPGYGIYLNTTYWKVAHNSINFNFAGSTSYGIYVNSTGGTNNSVKIWANNIAFPNPGSYIAYPIFIPSNSNTNVDTMDYNNIYTNATPPIMASIASILLTTTSNYKLVFPAIGLGANTMNLNPNYLSPSDLHTRVICHNTITTGFGANLYRTTDIDGNSLPSTPDIGADESFNGYADDAGVTVISTPTSPLVSGSGTPCQVTIKNFGTSTWNTGNISYSNNGMTTTEVLSGLGLASCASATYTFATNPTMVAGNNLFKVFTDSPNGALDSVVNNDTTQFNLCEGMAGLYTIDPAGSGPNNFVSFAAALNALNCSGLNGPVTFNVANGTYNENVSLPQLPGMSAANRLRFLSTSGNPALCIINANVNNSSAAVDLNGADHVTFRGFTIRNNFSSTAYGVYIRAGAHRDSISNCIIEGLAGNNNFFGVYQSNSRDTFNTIEGNTFNGGGYGIYMQGSTNLVNGTYSQGNAFIGNTFINQNTYGIYSYYQDSVAIIGNTITASTATSTYYGIFTTNNSRRPLIIGNKITITSSVASQVVYGMDHQSLNVSGNQTIQNRGYVVNNMVAITGNLALGTAYGMRFQTSCNYNDIYYNTVNITAPNTTTYAVYFNSGSVYDTVRNNIFMNTGGGTAATSGYAAYLNPNSNTNHYNNNVYGSLTTGNFLFWFGTGYANTQTGFNSFRTAANVVTYGYCENPAVNGGSFRSLIGFTSKTDLHTTATCSANNGFWNLYNASKLPLLVDFDGNIRSATPDRGCDEYTTTNTFDASVVEVTAPTSITIGLPNSVSFRVRNSGTVAINQLTMNYTANNGAPITQSFAVNLQPCVYSDTVLTFTPPVTFFTGGTNVLKVFASSINSGNLDVNNTNDTGVRAFASPYSGIYTINKNQPLSNSNFTSFNEAFTMIRTGTVNGPVTLNVVSGSGPYNEQLLISNPITGMSAINKITVDGSATKEMIWFNTITSNQQAVIRIVNAKHFEFKNLTINNPNITNCVGVFLTTNADSNIIRDCNINLASTSASNSAGIAIATNGTSVTGAGLSAKDVLLRGNRIRGGFYGITAYGQTNTPAGLNKRIRITDNFITNTYAHGINLYYYDSSEVSGNTIDSCVFNSSSYYSVNVQYCDFTHIRKNRINNFYYAGLYMFYLGNAFNNGTDPALRCEISNNMVGGARGGGSTNAYPVFYYYPRNCDFLHNTIGQATNTNGNYGLYIVNSNTYNIGNEIKNNIVFHLNNTGNYAPVYFTSTGTFFLNSASFDYNNFYGGSSSNASLYFNSTTYTGTSWISLSLAGQNTSHSVSMDPQFINPFSNLHTLSTPFNDLGLNTFITTDIDGDVRPIGGGVVDIGADEYTPPAENIGVAGLISPGQFPSGGLQNLVVKIKNFGSVTINSADVNYRVGQLGALQTVAWTGTLAPGDSTNVTFTGAMQYNNIGNNDTIVAYTSNPNAVPDGYQPNDTMMFFLCAGSMSGVYTVNSSLPVSSTNFQTLEAAIGKLNSCGISAATTINIANGTYTGQWVLNQVLGTSASSPLIIQSASGIAANVVLSYNGQTSYANNFVFHINGSDFVTIRNMTFTSTNAINGGLLRMNGDARDNKIANCVFNTTSSTNTSTTVPTHACLDMSEGGAGDIYRDTITNCSVNNGSIGILHTSPSRFNYGLVITNNTLSNQYYAGIYHNRASSAGNPIVIAENVITTNSGYSSFFGIYTTSSTSVLHLINKNRVIITTGGYGIYINTTTLLGSQCNNNMLVVNGSSTCYPLYLPASNLNIYNNSTTANSSLVGTYYSAYISSSPNIVRHNIFSVSGGNGCIYSAVANSVDSNIYYNTGATFGSTGTTYPTFAAWKAANPTWDAASIFSNPNFVSLTNLHLTGSSPSYTIKTNPMVIDDIDNLPRCGTSQAGCDHNGNNNDVGIFNLIYPPNGVAAVGSQSIKVLLRNYGTNTVTSANLYYNINGTQVKQAWTGSLGLCESDTVTFTTPYVFAPGPLLIQSWTDSPNAVLDSKIGNDSFNVVGCIGIAGACTINPALPPSLTNYQSFTDAVAAMTGCGISGPVVFTVSPGIYTEQITIPLIAGSSATNTITFDGVDRNVAKLQFYTTAGSEYIVRLSNTSNIYFKNLSILSTNPPYAWNFHVLNSVNCGINKCILGDSANTYNSTTYTNIARLLINGSTTSMTGSYSSSAGLFTCDSSIIHIGYYTVLNYVNNGNSILSMNGNTWDDNYFMALYSPAAGTCKIRNNRINLKYRSIGTTPYGIRIDGTPTAPNFHEVINNQVDSIYGYGIYLSGSGGVSNRNILANNRVTRCQNFASITQYETYLSGSYWDVYHNSYDLHNNNPAAYGLFIAGGTFNRVNNNIFVVSNVNGTNHYPLYLSAASSVSDMDNNVFYNVISNKMAFVGGSIWTNVNLGVAWPTGLGLGSRYLNPNFQSPLNLHVNPAFTCYASAPNVGIATDMDLQSRGVSTTIGADDAPAVTNDLGIDSLLNPPTLSITPGVQDIRVRIRNAGSNTVSTGSVFLVLNGVPAVAPLPSPLAPCDTVTITFAAKTFNPGFNTMLLHTMLPNGLPDNNTSNDSLYNVYCSNISGAFTIDKNNPLSATNFPSITAAVNAIYSCGISGPVVFNIVSGSGPYTEQNIFNGVVPGSSPTNTITFNGGATKETVQFQGGSQSSSHVFRLIGAKWITLQNMTIKTLDPNWGLAVNLTNGSDSNVVRGNNIIITGVNTDARNVAISLCGLGTTATIAPTSIANVCDYNIIDSNVITNGSTGISVVGFNAGVINAAYNNIITNNTMTNINNYGVYTNYGFGTQFINNKITMTTLSGTAISYGAYFFNQDSFKFNNNSIKGMSYGGAYFNAPNGNANSSNGYIAEFMNNMIGGQFTYTAAGAGGVFWNAASMWNHKIVNNTINVVSSTYPSSTNTIYGFYNIAGTVPNTAFGNCYFVNNNITLFGSSSSGYSVYMLFALGTSPITPFVQCDYNNIWTNDPSQTHCYIYNSGFTLDNWKSYAGLNLNSKYVNPNYINIQTNLHTIHPNLDSAGTNTGFVTDDIDGDIRNVTTPDIGADEFNVSPENIGAFTVVSPTYPMTAGLQNVVVNIKNFGSATITSANVRYKVGSLGSIKTIAWTGTLVTNANTNVTFSGANQYNFAGGFDTIFAWTDNPNGTTDGYQLNDSTMSIVCSPMTGTYTLDPGSPASITNFQTFASLKQRLNACGVSGPVVVNVANGTYTEQVEFNEVPGASGVNTITIQSATLNALNVTVQFNSASSAANNYVFDLNGADYFRFVAMTMSNPISLAFNGVIILRNVARDNQFVGCRFFGSSSLTTSTNQCIIFLGSTTTPLSEDSLVVKKCSFNTGSYGIYAPSTTNPRFNWLIDSNSFAGVTFYNIYVSNLRNSSFTSNNMNIPGTYANPYGMYFVSCSTAGADFYISKNKITGSTYYGIYLNSCTGTTANPIMVSNNFVSSNNPTAYGLLYLTTVPGVYVYNNSILSLSNSTAPYTVYLSSSSTPPAEFKHNIVYAKGNGAVSPYTIYNTSSLASIPSSWRMDSNVYFQGAGAAQFGYAGGNYATWATYKTAMNANGLETYSTFVNPLFVSNTDLHTTSPTNLLDVIANGRVTDDIDGESRSGLSDVGADHHPLANDLGVESIVYPSAGVAGAGLRDIKVAIRNYGANTLTSSTVGYNIDGHIETKPWSGSLASGQRDTIVFNGAQQHNFVGTVFGMSAWVDSISPLIYNDTAYTYGCIGLSGTYTIGGSGPFNFINFATAINAMTGCGISGPVLFNVAPGYYTEQVDIPAIPGQSAVNTITFDGGNPLTTCIRFACTGTAPSNYVLRFNATNYVTFRNISINNVANNSTAANVWIFNSTNIKVSKCMIGDSSALPGTIFGLSPATTGRFSSSILYRILLTGSATVAATSSAINHNIFIDSNILHYGYYGLYSYGNLNTSKVYVTNNIFNGAYFYDLTFAGAQVPYVRNNYIDTRTWGSFLTGNHYNIYFNGVVPAITERIEVSNNTIDSVSGMGIYLASSGSAANNNVCFNNIIYGNFGVTTNYGIYSGGTNWKIYHNTINFGSVGLSGTAYCLYGASSLNDCRNNVFTMTGSGLSTAVPVYASGASSFNNFNYNMFYNSNNSNVLQIGGFTYTQANYLAAYSAGAGLNSIWANPNYPSATNLHLSAALGCTIAGTPLGITTDIDGQTRSLLAPTMGADEVVRLATDLAVENITNPSTSSQPAGPATVAVLVRNAGNNQIVSGNISAQLNYNGTIFTVAFSDTINPCDTHTLYIPGVVFGGSGNPVDTLKVFSDGPNGTTDNNLLNDTAKRIICGPLNGAYTVGGASPDFVDLAAALSQLSCGGVSGPVTFNLRTGTYNGPFTIDPIIGSSTVNKVTFTAETGIATDVIIAKAIVNSFVIRINGADNIVFDKLTIRENTNANQVIAINSTLPDSASNITVSNCLLSNVIASSSVTYAVIASTGYNPTMTIKNNTITRSAGISIVGNNSVGNFNPRVVIDSNIFNTSLGENGLPIFMSFCWAPKIRYNTINGVTASGYQMISLTNVSGPGEISFNSITNAGTSSPITLVNMNNYGETTPFMIYNNFVNSTSASSTYYQMSVTSSNYVNIYHNSFRYATALTGNRCLFVTNNSGFANNVRIVNNIFQTTGPSVTCIYLNGTTLISAKANIAECNYNNYYQGSGSASEPLINVFGVTYTAATMKGAINIGSDSNSVFGNPGFISASNLRLSINAAGDGKAKHIPSITNDYDGTLRPAEVRDMGADDTMFIRYAAGDYTSVNCANLSGVEWINMYDTTGKLIFAINPNGNNLGSTCWSIRVRNSSDSVRKDSISNTVSGLKEYCMILDRNLVITPTNQPTNGRVYIRFFVRQAELNKLYDTILAKWGVLMNDSWVKIHKFHQASGPEGLDPLTNAVGADSSTFLAHTGASPYGVDKYFQYSVPGFSQQNLVIPFNNPFILPVTWTSFTAKAVRNDAVLDWTTSSEKNNDRFEVERSFDGKNFEFVTSLKGAGNSKEVRMYNSIDKDVAFKGQVLVYYRIKQVDFDGKYAYSEIKSVSFAPADRLVVTEINPNPFKDYVNVQFTLPANESVEIKVTDIGGATVKTVDLKGTQGVNARRIELPGLAAGAYFIKVKVGDTEHNAKLIKE